MTQPISIDPQELETWLDEFMAEQMENLHILGVTFSLVQNGELLLAKGYGYANLEQQIPVQSDRTLFRVGSISKLFTATAIMQLVEKGLLNLDVDVNKYLKKFQIEDNYPQTVTIANLLTHTAGFDDRLVGLFTRKAKNIKPLRQILAEKMPARVTPPGKAMSYSNCGYALLGYVVESVAGIPFSQYVDRYILQPLEMDSSSFIQPSHLTSNVALGYRYQNKQQTYRALPFQYISILPAGSFSATATDMAKFAIAHLQYGKYKSSRILQENTARQMQQQQFTHDPRLPGMAWGFMESFYNQQQAICHGGGLPGFTSLLYLFPSHNLGFFVSDNGQANLSKKLLEEFYDRYFPVEQHTNLDRSFSANQKFLKRYQGSYRNNRYARLTIGKIFLLGTPTLDLKVTADGRLCIPKTLKTPNPEYLQEIEPSLLQLHIKGKESLDGYFVAREKEGEVKTLFNQMGVLEKLSWYETNSFHLTLVGLFILILLSGSIFGILALTRFSGTSEHQVAQLLAIAVCSLNLLFIAGILFSIQELIYEATKKLFLLLCIPILTSILAVILSIFAILAWMNPEWSFIEQISYSIIAIASLGFIPFLNYWNLLGFRY